MSDTVHTAVTLALVSGVVDGMLWDLIFSRWALETDGYACDDVIGPVCTCI